MEIHVVGVYGIPEISLESQGSAGIIGNVLKCSIHKPPSNRKK